MEGVVAKERKREMKKLLITRLYNQKHNKIIYSNMHDEAGASSQENLSKVESNIEGKR